MNTKEFIKSLQSVVKEYIADEEAYSDDVQLRINTTNWQIDIADPEDDLPNCDYYPIMDLVSMSTTAPGQWEPDEGAIAEVAAEYVFTD
ncbi:MAG: hypothetical protein K2G90_10935 [Muribaculaceae bacterium]|nr:hypothetical protein [Muribaculaceae bacterium]